MRIHTVLRYTGLVLLFNSLFLFISFSISWFDHDGALFPLLYSGIISLLFGIFPIIFVPPTFDISNKEGYSIVVFSWLLSCLLGTIPYVMWGGEFTFTNALFESVSGYTTTGSTILKNVEALPRGLLFWRASTHWIGGVGIVVFVLVVLPSIARAKLSLYRFEMSNLAMDYFKFRNNKVLHVILYVYLGLTITETIALWIAGMDLFDAITHAFSTIATGGFSTRNLSVAAFHNVAIEIIIMTFMLLSGIHFGLLFAVVAGDFKSLFTSSVVRYYIISIFIGILLVSIDLNLDQYPDFWSSLRYASFQIISVGTTTGFATAGSEVWPAFSKLLLIFFTIQCACAGSTCGGLKADRVLIFFKSIRKQFVKMQHPNAVVTIRVNNLILKDDFIESVLLFITMYILILFVSSLLLTAMGVDLLTAFSGSAACLGNVGPGLEKVSSLGNFSSIPVPGLWVLSVVMLLGRLEIFGFLMIFQLRSWR